MGEYYRTQNNKYDGDFQFLKWNKQRTCLFISSQILNQIRKIADRYGLMMSGVMNDLAQIGYDQVKDLSDDELLNMSIRVKSLKYPLETQVYLYKNRFTDEFFDRGNTIIPDGATFSGYFSMCLKAGLEYISKIGVDNHFDSIDFIELMSIRRRLRLPNRNIDTELVKDPTINISGIGLFDE